jgi:hypothetical protein
LAGLGDGEVKGEIVMAVAGYDGATPAAGDDALEETWKRAFEGAGGDVRAALKAVAKELGIKKPEVWRRLVERRLVRD